jgi:hypothetical protein
LLRTDYYSTLDGFSAYKITVSFISSFTRLWTWWELSSSFCAMKALLVVLSCTLGQSPGSSSCRVPFCRYLRIRCSTNFSVVAFSLLLVHSRSWPKARQ